MSSVAHATPNAQPAFACSMTALLLARVKRVAGDTGVGRVLVKAGSRRTASYLTDVGNWISYDEAIALWDAGEAVTHDPNFAYHVGEDAIRFLPGSALAAVLRTLGSPEEHLRRLHVSAQRFSTAARLEAPVVRSGYAEVRAIAAPGFARHRQQCAWTTGLLTQCTCLFGLPPAWVRHESCQVLGAPDCQYVVTWDPEATTGDAARQAAVLEAQLEALGARLEGVFATASDLIASGDLEDTLARIADRAAQQVRCPSYLLAVRPAPDAELVLYQRGLDDAEARAIAHRVFTEEPPEHWCVAPVRSQRRDYGRLVAVNGAGATFHPAERELLDLYARYAATALDSATALLDARTGRDEAHRRDREARTLLDLARSLASAGTTEDVARRIAEVVPGVVDCDRVSVWLWDTATGELRRHAVHTTSMPDDETGGRTVSRPEDIPQLAEWLEHPDPAPFFVDMETSVIREPLTAIGAVASVVVPIATADRFLGVVQVSVRERPERLAPGPELNDRLSGLAAHAVIALENGRLLDQMTHQARHDQLSGLQNRLAFGERLTEITRRARESSAPVALFFIDLDRFKPVNDELGHEVGDMLLRAVADRLTACVRAGDALARLGGDEFAVLVENLESDVQLEAVTRRLEGAFTDPFAVGEHELQVGASVGRAVWPVDVDAIEDLLREADKTMYRIKRTSHGQR